MLGYTMKCKNCGKTTSGNSYDDVCNDCCDAEVSFEIEQDKIGKMNLVERLQEWKGYGNELGDEAADEIERLQAENASLRDALQTVISYEHPRRMEEGEFYKRIARKALATKGRE